MNDPIIRFRKPTNRTHPDYRDRFSLQSRHILQLRNFSFLMISEEDIEFILVALL